MSIQLETLGADWDWETAQRKHSRCVIEIETNEKRIKVLVQNLADLDRKILELSQTTHSLFRYADILCESLNIEGSSLLGHKQERAKILDELSQLETANTENLKTLKICKELFKVG